MLFCQGVFFLDDSIQDGGSEVFYGITLFSKFDLRRAWDPKTLLLDLTHEINTGAEGCPPIIWR